MCILARECGLDLELADIELESLVPVPLRELKGGDEYMARLPEFDAEMAVSLNLLSPFSHFRKNSCRTLAERGQIWGESSELGGGEWILASVARARRRHPPSSVPFCPLLILPHLSSPFSTLLPLHPSPTPPPNFPQHPQHQNLSDNISQ